MLPGLVPLRPNAVLVNLSVISFAIPNPDSCVACPVWYPTRCRVTSALVCCLALVLGACGQTEPQDKNRVAAEDSPSAYSSESLVDNSSSAEYKTGQLDSRAKLTAEEASDLCHGMITDTERQRIPKVAKPPFRQYYKDPVFGSKVMRISDSAPGEVNKPAYSTMQAWNADETLMILYRTGGDDIGHYLHDGKDYSEIRKLDIVPKDLEEVFWSYKNPDVFYYVSKAEDKQSHFLKANARTGSEELIEDFSQRCPSIPTAGGDVQMHSHDDDVFAFRCGKDEVYDAFTYRISDASFGSMRIGKNTKWSPWFAPAVAPSGDRFQLNNHVFDAKLKKIETPLDFTGFEHASIGKTSDGQDAWFTTTFNPSPAGCENDMWTGVGHLVEFNMETGSCRAVLNQADGVPFTTKGTHVSATGYQRPGWVAMSSIGYESLKHLEEGLPAPALLSEIYLVNTDPENEQVCRLAHHRSHGKAATKGGYKPYFGEPHATLSPSGTRILFGSDWYDSGSVDAYVIELPAYQR